MGVSKNVTGALRAQEHGHQPIVYGISSYESNAMKSGNPHSGIYEAETSRTLDLNGGSPACNQDGILVLDGFNLQKNEDLSPTLMCQRTDTKNVPMVVLEGNGSRPSHRGDGYVESETMYTLNSTEHHVVCIGNGQTAQLRISDKAGTLNCMHDQQAVVTYGIDRAAYNQGINAQYDFAIDEEKVGCQVAKGPGAVLPWTDSIVRRLTPMECERLQAFPDHWTDIGEWTDSKGKKHKDADSPRYKALGNSIALPFWEWMAKRMRKSYPENADVKMASLFDGIGGFPLSFSRAGVEPVWASEIEEFPIAVTKIHFPDME